MKEESLAAVVAAGVVVIFVASEVLASVIQGIWTLVAIALVSTATARYGMPRRLH